MTSVDNPPFSVTPPPLNPSEILGNYHAYLAADVSLSNLFDDIDSKDIGRFLEVRAFIKNKPNGL